MIRPRRSTRKPDPCPDSVSTTNTERRARSKASLSVRTAGRLPCRSGRAFPEDAPASTTVNDAIRYTLGDIGALPQKTTLGCLMVVVERRRRHRLHVK